MRNYIKNIILLFSIITTLNASAQIWYKVDKGLSSYINNLHADTLNNLLYVCGDFQSALDTIECRGIGVWNVNGNNWSTLPYIDMNCSGGTCSQPIYNTVSYNGSVFSAGVFGFDTTSIDTLRYLRRWDGIQWVDCGKPNYLSLNLHITNNELFALGQFYMIDSVPVNHIVKWNGAGWDSFGDTTSVFDVGAPLVIKYINGDYYAGGSFSGYPGMSRIAKWDGVQWSAMQNGILGNSWILDIQEYKNYIFVSGKFYQSAGNPADFVMAWDGSQWINPFPNVQYLSQVSDLDVIDNQLYIAGEYQIAGDTSIYGLARYDGTNFCAFGGVGIYPKYLEVLNDTLYVAVNNTVLSGDTVNYIVRAPLSTPNQNCSFMPLFVNSNKDFFSARVFPNPASDEITLQWTEDKNNSVSILIHDQLGKTIVSKDMISVAGINTVSINTSKLNAGIYFILIAADKKTFYSKLILL